MEFKTYWRDLGPGEGRDRFAQKVGSTVGYLNLVAGRHKSCGESLAMRIEEASARLVTVEETCPNAPWHVLRGGPKAEAPTKPKKRSKRPDQRAAA